MAFCIVPNCRDLAFFECSCSDSIRLCEKHLGSHLSMPGKHTLMSSATTVSSNLKPQVSEYLRKNKHQISRNIIQLMQFTEQIIKNIRIEFKNIYRQLSLHKKIFSRMILSLNEKSTVSNKILEEILNSSHNKVELIEYNYQKIPIFVKDLFHSENKNPNIGDDDYGFFFYSSKSDQIDLINLETFKKSTRRFQNGLFAQYCGSCKIDENKYFVHGGYDQGSSSNLSSSLILDLKVNSVKICKSGPPINSFGICFLNNEIYTFGGLDRSSGLSDCKKFNLLTNVWSDIQSLPKGTSCGSATVLKNKAFVADYNNSSIFCYDYKINSFSISNSQLVSKSHKFIMENWLVCFEDGLFEYDENMMIAKKQSIYISKIDINSSSWSKKGNYIHFISQRYDLFRINTLSKQLEVISIN